jgi:hypothetical protein
MDILDGKIMANGDIKTRSWIKDNILGIVISVLLSGFLLQYQEDRTESSNFRKDVLETQIKLNNRQMMVCRILIDNPNTDPYYKEILREWMRIETRGSQQ